MSRGYDKKRSLEFEHTRVICYTLAAVNRSSEKAFPTMNEFWPLPTDEEAVKETKEELEEMHARLLAELKNRFPKKFKD